MTDSRTDSRTLTVLRKLIVDTVNADPHLPWGHLDDEVAERVAVAVLAQLNGLEPGEVTTEWGIDYTTGSDRVSPWGASEAEARRRVQGAPSLRLMTREVRIQIGPWTEVAS